jgi:hypothetical protein
MKPWLKLFCAGYLFHTALQSLYQDAIGKEKYLRIADLMWVDAWYTVPLATAILIVALLWIKEGKL